MRNRFSGRRRFALVCLVVVGGLVTAAGQCAPPKEPPKEQAPASLSIDPTSHDFGNVLVNDESQPKTFTVTNDGGATSGPIAVALEKVNQSEFGLADVAGPACPGKKLEPGETCVQGVVFEPQTTGPASDNLVVSGSPGGSATAEVSGTGTQ